MRHGTSSRRQRNRGGRRGGSGQGGAPNRMQVFDSNGPDVRIRGTAYQVCEKYLTLAKDAASAGDDIMAQNYLQHAEHYQRIINEFDLHAPQHQRPQFNRNDNRQDEEAEADGNAAEAELSLPASILGAKPKVDASEPSELATAE